MLQMSGLEHIGESILRRRRTETLCVLSHTGRFMAQRLHQAQHAVLAHRGAEQQLTDQSSPQFAGGIVEHRVARRRNILEQLLHQRVVVIGELFQHREAGLLLAVEIASFEGYDFGRLVFAIDEGALQRQIDETRDQFAVPHRNVSQHQRNPRRRLQCRERLADALVGAVDLVEKQKARDRQILEFAQDKLKLRQLAFVGFAYHHRGIDRRDRGAHVVRELHRAGAIDKSVAVAHETCRGGGKADAHLVAAGLGAGIADRSSGVNAAGAGGRARARQYRFKKCGFTALEEAHQCNAPWTARTSDVLSHCRLLIWSSPLDAGGRLDAPPTSTIWQAGKMSLEGIVSWTRCSVLRDAPQSLDPFANEMDPGSAAQHFVLRCIRGTQPYLPGRSSRLSSPAATLRPTWPWTLSGCSAIEFADPPTSTLPPTPTPTDALPCAPA